MRLFSCHEKVLAELKTGYAFDTVPTQNYVANSAWQVLAVLSHNLVTNFQIDTGATRRGRTAKRSPLFILKSIRTLRYELIARAGVLRRPAGRQILTLGANKTVWRVVERIQKHLAKAA